MSQVKLCACSTHLSTHVVSRQICQSKLTWNGFTFMAVSQTFFLKFQMWQSHTINCQLKSELTCKGYFCSGPFPFCKYYSNPKECRPDKELFRLNHTTVASVNLAPLHYKHLEKVLLRRALPRLVEKTFIRLPTGVSLLLNPSDTHTLEKSSYVFLIVSEKGILSRETKNKIINLSYPKIVLGPWTYKWVFSFYRKEWDVFFFSPTE